MTNEFKPIVTNTTSEQRDFWRRKNIPIDGKLRIFVDRLCNDVDALVAEVEARRHIEAANALRIDQILTDLRKLRADAWNSSDDQNLLVEPLDHYGSGIDDAIKVVKGTYGTPEEPLIDPE